MVGLFETCMKSGFGWHYCNIRSGIVAFFGILAA